MLDPNYNACGYISSPAYHCPEYPELARRVADENGWNYREFGATTACSG